VFSRHEAATKFALMPERIGELVVIGDADTVFGELAGLMEDLEPGYRSHGSLHESDIPLVIYNPAEEIPPADAFTANLDLTRHTLARISHNGIISRVASADNTFTSMIRGD
jgi:phosphonoacetate hydrolase